MDQLQPEKIANENVLTIDLGINFTDQDTELGELMQMTSQMTF